MSSVERYDPRSDRWEAVQSMSVPRWTLSVGVLGDHLYAVGGKDNDECSLSSVERYDPKTDSWEAVEAMSQKRDLFSLTAL